MSQPESRLSRKIRDGLKATWGFKVFCFKVWGSEHMMSGLPDLIGCCHGRFFALEVKMPASRNDSTPKQKLVGEWISEAGGIHGVVCSPAEAVDLIRSYLPQKLR